MDTAKELLEFKFSNHEIRIQNLLIQLEDFFSKDPIERLQNSSQSIYLQFRIQKLYQIWTEQFELKESVLFPFFRKHFPKRERELEALNTEMYQLKDRLRKMILFINQRFAVGVPNQESNSSLGKIAKEGKELIAFFRHYFILETSLFHEELLKELREDEAEVFFRKMVRLQNERLNLY